MKIFAKLFCAILIFSIACAVDDNTPETPIQDGYEASNATLVKQGSLVGVNHTVSGLASIYEKNGEFTVLLDPYSSQNGPDLKIYLSKDANASDYVKLGNLKSTMGKQSYPIPSSTDITQYNYVHVWCEKYTVVFAIAEMK